MHAIIARYNYRISRFYYVCENNEFDKTDTLRQEISVNFPSVVRCEIQRNKKFPSLRKHFLYLFLQSCLVVASSRKHWFGVPLKHCSSRASFFRLSVSGTFTLVHRKATAVCTLGHALSHQKGNCATMWWKSSATSLFNLVWWLLYHESMVWCGSFALDWWL